MTTKTTDRRGFLKMFGGVSAAAAAAALVPRKSAEELAKDLVESPDVDGLDFGTTIDVDAESVPTSREQKGQFQFRTQGPLKRHDFVTLADGGLTVRQGGFDEHEHLLGIVVEIVDSETAWVAVGDV